MEEKQKEMRADAPKATTYQLVEVLTPDGRRVWQFNLTTPAEDLVDDVMFFIRNYLKDSKNKK